MNRYLKMLAALGATVATTASLPAAITTSVTFNSTTGAAGLTAWPNAVTLATTATPSTYASSENNYGGSSLFSLGQSWTATTSGNLTRMQIGISGTAPVSFTVSLYDAGVWNGVNLSPSDWSNVGDAAGHTYAPGGNVSANLFTDVSLQTWTSYTLAGATAAILDFSLTGADQVSITAGNQYIFEISSTSNPNGMVWLRNGADATDYSGGQSFRQRAPLNGNALRDMSLATTVAAVPEPSSMALAGLGFAAAMVLRRRNA